MSARFDQATTKVRGSFTLRPTFVGGEEHVVITCLGCGRVEGTYSPDEIVRQATTGHTYECVDCPASRCAGSN